MKPPTIMRSDEHDPASTWPVGGSPTPQASIDILRRAVDTVEALLCQPPPSCVHIADCETERAISFVVPCGVKRARADLVRAFNTVDAAAPPTIQITTTTSGGAAADVITMDKQSKYGKTLTFGGPLVEVVTTSAEDDAAPAAAKDRMIELPEGLVWTVEDGTIAGCSGWAIWAAVQTPDRETL